MPEPIENQSNPAKEPKKKLRCLLHTFGCQMNVYDSELAEGFLAQAGFEVTTEGGHPEEARLSGRDDEGSRDSLAASCLAAGKSRPQDHRGTPDVILFNTCSVRDHAEERVFGRLRELKYEKKRRPELIIGLMGCMVENYKEKLLQDYPHLDLICGTRSIRSLPALIERVKEERRQVAEIAKQGFGYELYEYPRKMGRIHAFLPVMTGCDKICSFCIVPYVRGREISRPLREVAEEARRLADSGYVHVTLVGQNVNSYGRRLPDQPSFATLLRAVAKVPGIQKISFTTSHPQDAIEELFLAIRDEPKISRRFHLPLQSGSDRILALMKRNHSLADYRRKIDGLRELVPEVSLTTDIIVGFPSETEEDFDKTREAMQSIAFDGAFIFKFSPRGRTPAARMVDDVPLPEKNRRNNELLALQKEISRQRNVAQLGETVPVLVEDYSKKKKEELLGRSWQEKKVVFRDDSSAIGTVQQVKLLELFSDTFVGDLR